MTRKLTDEQVKAIKKGHDGVRIPFLELPSCNGFFNITVSKIGKSIDVPKSYWLFYTSCYSSTFYTPDEAIAYTEHLLNQRYQWLPQNNGWIMSGEVYNFANGGVNKVLELVYLAKMKGGDWYCVEGVMMRGFPSPSQYAKGITIPADSPIWDAVKGLSDD